MITKIIKIAQNLVFLILCLISIIFYKIDCSAAVNPVNVQTTDNFASSLIDVPRLHKVQAFSLLKGSSNVTSSGISGTCSWKITKVNELNYTLEIGSGTLATGTEFNEIYGSTSGGSNWNYDSNSKKITEVKIDQGVSLPQNATGIFGNMPSVTTIQGLDNLDISNTTSMRDLFAGCKALTTLDLSKFDTSKVTDMSSMFKKCQSLTSLDLSKFDTSNVTNMSSMFNNCQSLTNLDLSKFDTSNVTNMSSMFNNCQSLTNLDLSKFDTSNVTDMSSMFSGCSNLKNLDLNNFDTSKVTNMSSMFSVCSNLTNLDLSKFDTSNVENMPSMFYKCSNLKNLDLSNFDTSKVSLMDSMFNGCSNLTNVNLSSFNTSKVYSMLCMFDGCSNLPELDLSSFDTSAITNMNSMFHNCNKLWKITMGKQFKIIKDSIGSYPTAPLSQTRFFDDGKKYNSSGDGKWQAVNSGNGGTVHKPKGDIFANNVFPEQREKDGQETYVWEHQLFNEAPKIEIDKDSVKKKVKYPYVEDYRKSDNSLPPFEITGNVSDSDSDSVSIYYTIDKEIDPNDPDQLNTIGCLSDSVNTKEGTQNFNVGINKKDDLKILATPKKGGHKIWIYALDSGSQGAKDNSKLSDPKQCWIAENGIINFQYIGPEGKMLKQPKTLVKIINTETNISEENPDYYYKVSDYLPKSIWTSSTRYSLSEFPSDLKSLSDNKDRGRIPSTIKENDIIRTVRLNYYPAGQVSLKQVPSLDFGSHVSQKVLQGDQLNLQHDAKQDLIVNDTTQRNTTDPNWRLSLEIKPLKDGIGFFRYYKDGNNYVDVSNFSNIASSEDTDLDTRDAAAGKETNISNNWWNTKDNKQIKGPKLVLNQGNPPAGKYVTEATWNIENVPL